MACHAGKLGERPDGGQARATGTVGGGLVERVPGGRGDLKREPSGADTVYRLLSAALVNNFTTCEDQGTTPRTINY